LASATGRAPSRKRAEQPIAAAGVRACLMERVRNSTQAAPLIQVSTRKDSDRVRAKSSSRTVTLLSVTSKKDNQLAKAYLQVLMVKFTTVTLSKGSAKVKAN